MTYLAKHRQQSRGVPAHEAVPRHGLGGDQQHRATIVHLDIPLCVEDMYIHNLLVKDETDQSNWYDALADNP